MGYDHYSRVWASIWLEPWDDDMKLLGFYLLTGPQRRTGGIYRLPLDYAAGDMKWNVKKVRAALDRLIDDGFVAYDETSHVVLILNALKRHGLNDNQIKGEVKAFQQLPPSPLLDRFVSLAQSLNQSLAKALDKVYYKALA